MEKEILVHAIVVGGSLLGLWLYVRLGERRRPRTLGRACAHVGLSVFLLLLVPIVSTPVGKESGVSAAAVLFGLFLPAITYTFTAALALLEQLQRSLSAR